MIPIDGILSSISGSMKTAAAHIDYPNSAGLYAFQLASNSVLQGFGSGDQIIYVGKAEDSLRRRDLNTHFKANKTGWSTLRRSIGAILKKELNATSFSRNGTLNPPNIDNYKFDSEAEFKLTAWMNATCI